MGRSNYSAVGTTRDDHAYRQTWTMRPDNQDVKEMLRAAPFELRNMLF
jgi:hypothetical protein